MKFPNVFFLSEQDIPALREYLRRVQWLDNSEELLEAHRAGQGNMNYVLRVRTGRRSFILKQSRPWVEKYPQIAAPWDRALVEAEFYRTLQDCPALASSMPRLLGFDADAHLLKLEDLGPNPAFDFLYSGGAFRPGEVPALQQYLERLHSTYRDARLRTVFANVEMRALNHEHMFQVPFDSANGINLDSFTPGLAALANVVLQDPAIRHRVKQLSHLYLSEGECLLHGDFFPGSWIRVPEGVKIIDPEFCFFGPPEFDWGVMLAHFYLSQSDPNSLTFPPLDIALVNGFAGVEIMRRLLGVAQLPLTYELEQKRLLLQTARGLLLEKPNGIDASQLENA